MHKDYSNGVIKHIWPIDIFFKTVWELIKRKEILYCIDLKAMNADSGLRLDGISVECYRKLSDVPFDQMELLKLELLNRFKSKEILMTSLIGFFDRGGCLWFAKTDGKVVSSIWTFSGRFLAYYIGHPILPNDSVLMAGRTFSEFRGRGYFAAMIRLICEKLRDSGVSRVYCGAHIRNLASQRSQEKVLTRIGTNRHCRFFKWYIVVWDRIHE